MKKIVSRLSAAVLWGDASREARSLRTPGGREMQRYSIVVLATSVPLYFMAVNFFGLHVLLMAGTALAASLATELLFSLVRKKPVHGNSLPFALLTGLLLPAWVVVTRGDGVDVAVNMPLWVVASGAAFGTVIGKEIFGGYGDHIFCPALVAKGFVVWSFPKMVQLPGDNPVLIEHKAGVWMGHLPVERVNLFSSGELTVCFIIVGLAGLAMILVNFRNLFTLIGIFAAGLGMACLFGGIEGMQVSDGITAMDAYFSLPLGERWQWLAKPSGFILSGGFFFGACLLACDPAVNPRRCFGSLLYGLLIGVFAVSMRQMSSLPYSTMMSAILVASLFAPLIDALSPSLIEDTGVNDEK